MKNAFSIVKDFEHEVAAYTGAPYCVAVNSCTNALFLCLAYQKYLEPDLTCGVQIPKHTYISVPMQIKHAGFWPTFRDQNWQGMYQLKPFNIYDAARRFTDGMFAMAFNDYDQIESGDARYNTYMCVSFHWSKILGIQQGGAILHNNYLFDEWARRARFDGRTEGVAPKNDKVTELGWHMYLSPEIAAEGIVRLMHLPKDNPDLPNDAYPDLSTLEIFK